MKCDIERERGGKGVRDVREGGFPVEAHGWVLGGETERREMRECARVDVCGCVVSSLREEE